MLDNEIAIVEAILFLENEPISLKNLIKVSKLAPEVLPEVLQALEERYSKEDSGIELVEARDTGYILTPKKKLYEILEEHYGKQNEQKLSRAALETLTIIAYSQPITRNEIDNLRGVSSDSMIRLLQKSNFIKEMGKKDVPGKPTLYGTTKEFLQFFQLKSIAELPKMSDSDKVKFELNG